METGCYGMGAFAGVQLTEQAACMSFDRVLGNEEFRTDLCVVFAVGHSEQHLQLFLGKREPIPLAGVR